MITSVLFTAHIILYGVKMWAIYELIQRYELHRALLVWCFAYFVFEAWFLYNFYIDIDLYLYEIYSIADQIIFTIMMIYYLIKEGDMAKGRTNGGTPRPPKK